ncbi:Metalloenzyme, LuxS/M16 peptidase-like protein [Cynara cardunculus var. scolymus]|uniref:Metalloenzyme, LuxS/M16 peptidase-like protein n=1 Tax=Cynara cardunculus var. scolymus TaxID=59895 RepID=A0A118JVJ5_CYNCS|nr:Metalloenzyme, LuxS/M16 peptidase-like protein [Cynara cardunculus var. scolymus]
MAVGGCTFSSDDIVVKSPNDRRLYRYIQLPNETVIVIVLQAAAAMCVGMGSFCDPLEAQGLAHFLEHMLFMGSAEFPDENEYDSYLSKHGGSSNAYTEVEHTCYHFEVKSEFLQGALRRFSQFFISPLVKTEAMDREVQAVDSGVFILLLFENSRNKKSLVDAMEKGINLRDQILKFYNDFYHGGLMKLVIIGGETLDVLESWVLELFSNVKTNNAIKSEVRQGIPIWSPGKIYRLEAVKDVHILDLSWTLPCLRKDYLKKAEDYLAHLIGHEGRGSLLFFLKAKGWATSISAGVGDDGMHRSSVAYIFGMSIHLTDSGLEKIYEIIGFVYQYLKLLQQVSPQEWIYRELQDIANMDFTFAEEQPQDEYAAELSENLLIYPPEHTIYGDYAYKVWDEEMVKHVLTFFTPDNMRTDILSKSFNKPEDVQCEPWFGSQYIEENIPQSLLELWRDPPEIDVSLHLPAKNEFIPQDFSIRANTVSCNSTSASPPKCILDEPLMKFWYKLDKTFQFPRANTYFRVTLNGAYRGLKNVLLTELFLNLLKDKLNDIASVAKLETSISLVSDKLELKVYGFNDKLPVLLSKILETAKSFLPTDERFVVIKEDMERTLRNVNMKPLNHSSYLRLQLYIEGLCHGNLLEEEAENISYIFRKYFSVQPLPSEMRHKESILCLPSNADLVRDVPVKNKLDTNSVVELYYQIEPEVESKLAKSKALVDLLDEIIEEPLFNQLRTKEQLGYVVDCSPRVTYRILGFCFRVQSSEYSPSGLDDESFQNFKSGLIAKLLEKDPSLAYETNRYWGQIIDQR